jgi:hypothetical protein
MAEKPRNKQGGANSKKMIFIFMFVDFLFSWQRTGDSSSRD